MDRYDLIVVGSSFSSTFFLKKYLEKKPQTQRILVLERGYLHPYQDRMAERNEVAGAKRNPNPENTDTFINTNPKKPWVFTVGFGGNSNCWYACTPRFLPNDFRMKTLYGVSEDWPVQYDDIEYAYSEVEAYMNVAGPEETPFPRKKGYPQPPHLFTDVDKALKAKYGNLYINQPTARARLAVDGRNACCASATCHLCPVNAKFTIENSGLAVYSDPRVTIRYGAQVTELSLQNDTVQNVVYVENGVNKTAKAEVYALGANAIFNAHILLNSGDKNKNTGVGLGEQYGIQVDVMLKDMKSLGGSTWVNANGYMLYDGAHRKEAAACLIESSNYAFIRPERGKWRNMASYRLVFEDIPEAHNYVTTSEDRLKPKVIFKGPSEYALRGVERAKKLLPEVLSVLPVEDIKYHPPHDSEAHILGTTRMSKDATTGVVDKNLIHHQYRNLFVLGSGTFTTFTPANPTLTLSALSLYAADKSF